MIEELNTEELERYKRNILIDGFGVENQLKLANARVLVVGAGGLGSPALLYLAASGIGTIGIIDDDKVDISNLQRQIAHSTVDIGKSKVVSAKESISAINPNITVNDYEDRLTIENAETFFLDYDIVIDATDNFSSKFLINDVCILMNKPYIHGVAINFHAQVMTVIPSEGTSCYRCLRRSPPEPQDDLTQRPFGTLGVTSGLAGIMQATECIKFIVGEKDLYINKIYYHQLMNGKQVTLEVVKNPMCPVCGVHPIITTMQGYDSAIEAIG